MGRSRKGLGHGVAATKSIVSGFTIFFGLHLRSHLLRLWETAPCTLSSGTRAIVPISFTLATSLILRDPWGTLATRAVFTTIWVQGALKAQRKAGIISSPVLTCCAPERCPESLSRLASDHASL